jgi:acylphosphatase
VHETRDGGWDSVPGMDGAIRREPEAGGRQAQDAGPRHPVRLTAVVRGRVQGVGFRWWTRSRALELGLVGSATNLDDGRVEVVAEGARQACERLLTLLSEQPPSDPPPGAAASWYRRPGRVTGVTYRWSQELGGRAGFVER